MICLWIGLRVTWWKSLGSDRRDGEAYDREKILLYFLSLLGGMAVIKGERVSFKKSFQISIHIHLLYRMPDLFSLPTTDLFPKKL